MNKRIPEHLERAMEQAAMLSPQDPDRQAVVDRVKAAGPDAEAAWLELVEEDERLRLTLQDVRVPDDLQSTLLEIPTTHTSHGWAWMRWLSGAAAVVVAATMVTFGVWSWSADSTAGASADTARHVAMLTAEDLAAHAPLTIRSSNRAKVASVLQAASGMAVDMPNLGPEYALVGGRVCELNGKRVICTRWLHNGKMHSVYQLDRQAFGLPRALPAQRFKPTIGQTRYEAVVWSSQRCAYAMICDERGQPVTMRFAHPLVTADA